MYTVGELGLLHSFLSEDWPEVDGSSVLSIFSLAEATDFDSYAFI